MTFLSIFFYDFILKVYYLLILFSSLFNNKAKKWIKGRKNIFSAIQQFTSTVNPQTSKIIWFHCSSLGEFEQGRPLIEKIKEQNHEYKIVLTFFSPSGYEVRKKYSEADAIFYLPLDTKKNAEIFLEFVQPQLAIFVKYEFWYHYLNTLHKKNIPAILISAKFRDYQIFFQWYGKLFKDLLKKFKHIFVQDKNSFDLLHAHKIQNISIANDTRFDRVVEISKIIKPNMIIEKFKQDKNIIIAGSTWEQDERIISNLKITTGNFKIIIAPHEINESRIESIIRSFSESKIIRYSLTNENNVTDKNILIIDNIGMLSSLYQYGKIAFIGGGFGKGIHNILEAAVFGLPIFFGPHYKKFNEAVDLVNLGGAFVAEGNMNYNGKLFSLMQGKEEYTVASAICKKYVQSKTGGTATILNYLNSSIKIFS